MSRPQHFASPIKPAGAGGFTFVNPTYVHGSRAPVVSTNASISTNDVSPKSGTRPRQRKTTKSRKDKSWKSLFCIDGSGGGGQGGFMDGLYNVFGSVNKTGKGKSRSSRRAEKFELDDGTQFTVDYGDCYSADWDLMEGPGRNGGRRGPQSKSPNELDIKFRDLFPCFGEIFDFCGCAKAPSRRGHYATRNADTDFSAPKLETVCLDCGHVLDHQNLAKSVLQQGGLAMSDTHKLPPQWSQPYFPERTRETVPALKPLFDYGYGEPTRHWEEQRAFSNYEGWKYAESKDDFYRDRDEGFVPLPRFGVNEPRQFRSRPARYGGDTIKSRHAKYFDIDETGRVALPDFPAK